MMTREQYDKSIHRFGIASGWFLIFLMLGAPCLICTMFGIWPPMAALAPSFVAVFMIMTPNAIADIIAYP